ncbi:MAG: hypothetical protein EXR72_11675 [Myxococcales bacterium]|nr:hypothetical protein [Myxococcales bacterium]
MDGRGALSLVADRVGAVFDEPSTKRARWIEALLVVVLLATGAGFRYRINTGWLFAGSDSYGYLRLADELHQHGRYSLGPGAPLHYARMPLYPLFIALVKGDARAEAEGGDGWNRITRPQIGIDVLATGLLVYFIARRLGGRAGGLSALGLVMLCPFLAVWPAAALTESLAMAVSTALIALLVGEARSGARYFAAGALLGAGVLLRQDTVLLGAAFVPALLLLRVGWWTRARLGLIALASFALVFAAWPIRNLHHFGDAHAFGERVDRQSNPFPNALGFHHWMATWAPDGRAIPRFVFCFNDRPCPLAARDFPEAAFEGAERATVEKLIQQRTREGFTDAVNQGFESLAVDRRARHPFDCQVGLPLRRAVAMWFDPHDDILKNPRWLPWPALFRPLLPHFLRLVGTWLILFALASVLLLSSATARPTAVVILVAMLARTLVMAWLFYVEPRYTVEVMPIGCALIGAGIGEAMARLRRRSAPSTRSLWPPSRRSGSQL